MTTTSVTTSPRNQNPRPSVCFSFAAYSKKVIRDFKSANIPVGPGLSDEEFHAVESIFNFTFPPDLRAFLREGLPLGPGFTNWRSSSAQQLQILVNLPVLGLLKEVSKDRFWASSWPEKPDNIGDSLTLTNKLLQKAPVLLPVYRYCYIPCSPNTAGNPVFYINGSEIRVLSFDLTGFFHQVDFRVKDSVVNRRPSLSSLFRLPAWAAEEARGVEFWSEVAACDQSTAACDQSTAACDRSMVAHDRSTVARGELVGYMEGVWGRLRDGGWKEEEVREMMMEMDGEDCVLDSREEVDGHVRGLSVRLLSAGWSTEDVVESLGCEVFKSGEIEPTSWCDFQHMPSRFLEVV